MADKEPRRRKKRRDSQKKEDVRHTEEQFFASMKSDSRESDQEVEEEIISHHHHAAPSNLAKVVFVILFSGLVVSLSFIFISLRDVDKGPIDIFDMDHGGHHGEALHDEHVEEAVHDDDHHEEKSEVTIDDFIPGLSSIFSLNNEVIKEVESPEIPSQEEDKDEKIDRSETDIKPESSVDQGILEEYIEDIPAVSIGESLIEEPSSSSSEVYPETTIPVSHSEEIYSTVDYAESEEVTTSLPSDEPELSSELFSSQEPEEISPVYNFVDEAEEIPPTESLVHMPEDLPTTASSDDVDEEDAFPLYEKADITNEADYEIRESLDVLDDIVIKSPDRALVKCEELLKQHPDSPRLHYIKAQALDSLAESHRSNKYLEEAIAAYQKTMSSKNVPEELYLLAGKKAADRMRFRGFAGKSLKLLAEMSDKFPLDVELKNLVAVGYLLIGQNKLAKKVLLETLKISPESGFTKVHLGFILKTDEANYEDSIKYLSEGIATREKGVIDGRFYFHLGDALHRIGKNEEAMKVYEEAVKEGLFLSVYQRSLYNVDNLTGKPWWDPQSTKYAPDIKILEKNWITIRDEALSLISEKYSGFMPEAEGLQDKGDWKQLELFARGRKIEKNCQKAPKTCALISQIPDAANCKRGQVKFSIVHPGTHVWAHTGPTNCRLRAHLGLVVPQGVSIRVAEETRQWEEGKVILFDDSFEHEVWHNGSTYRLVLIVDFWHPELSAYQKRSLTPI